MKDSIILVKFQNVEMAENEDNSEPHIVVIAENLMDIQTTYVVLGNQKYYFDYPLDAIERCFYYFWGCDVQYPPKANHIWYFIQKSIFNIRVGSQQLIPAIEELCNEFNVV